jgi:DNA modification methylase
VSVVVLRGDARDLPLPDSCVDLVVTSPPYFGLRSYTDGGEHYAGQVGSEVTPAAYVEALVGCTAEWMRVLKPSGSLFVNLGDKYAGAPSGPRTPMPDGANRDSWRETFQSRRRVDYPVREKSLLGLPWRYALACIDDLGLILRAEIIWAKPNGLPESVGDRVRRGHELVFHFTVRPWYYSAVDEIREGYAPGTAARYAAGYNPRALAAERLSVNVDYADAKFGENPLGKLPGSVWSIPSQPLTVPERLGVDHFAAFPMELPRRIILGWSPPGVCTACGEGRRPVTRVGLEHVNDSRMTRARQAPGQDRAMTNVRSVARQQAVITGYACACPSPGAPARPAVVLDPFGGTGTTALLAHVNGRAGITVDLSADYCRIARWRTSDRRETAAAMQVERPAPVPDAQDALFDL